MANLIKRCGNTECGHLNDAQAMHCSRCGSRLPTGVDPRTGIRRRNARMRIAIALTGGILGWMLITALTGHWVGGFIAGALLLAALIVLLMILGGVS